MKTNNSNTMTLEEFKEKHYGKIGTPQRNELEVGSANFRLGALSHEAQTGKSFAQITEGTRKVGHVPNIFSILFRSKTTAVAVCS
ncbi:hypothetical protein AGMMS4957_13240 [Bacteroidia bacterium]|nr:hypothetical protein AGMMS4957_13240 [Bacteroidia bacterium]